MYDYATVTKQNQIIGILNETNTNIETLNTTIKQTGLTVAVLIAIILIKSFVNVMTGRR